MHLSPRIRRALPWALLALAVIVTAAVYWPGLTGGWVFDDYPNIADNPAIHITPGHSTLAAWVNAALSSPASFLHRPLASITFALNWYFSGADIWWFKFTNVVIHVINGVLVFCMLRALLRLLALRRAAVVPCPSGRGCPEGAGEGTHPRDIDTLRVSGPSPPTPLPQGEGSKAATSPSAPLPRGEGFNADIDDAAATRLALIVAVAWMLLPINLMAVLYVVQRMESLCQVFVLAGLWAYLHGRWMMLTGAGDAARNRRGFALAVGGVVLGTVLGLTSKETAVLLPVFAFLAEWIVIGFGHAAPNKGLAPQGAADSRAPEPSPPAPLPGGEGSKALPAEHDKADKRIWTLFTVTLFVPGVLGFAWLLRAALRASSWSGRDFTLAQRLMTETRVLVDYLHWTLFPNPMVLSLYHDEIVKSTGLLHPWTTLGSMLLLAALIAVAVWLRKHRPLVALGIAWFFASQLLTATIVPLELVYEQRMYFGSIGVLLAAGVLLLGLRWKIALPILRGFLVAVALLWFGVATNLRTQEWSNPVRLATIEANRHATSARANYTAGREWMLQALYKPGPALDLAWKYLRRAAAIPDSSALPDQALIMLADHKQQGDDDAYWQSMIRKLRDQPTRQEDISALISLTHCYRIKVCVFDVSRLRQAYEAALSRPHPIARLLGAYADFQRDVMHDDSLAVKYLARAVQRDPSEPAYRVDLAALYAQHGQTMLAMEQIDALRRMDYAGRLDGQIDTLERLAEQGKTTP